MARTKKGKKDWAKKDLMVSNARFGVVKVRRASMKSIENRSLRTVMTNITKNIKNLLIATGITERGEHIAQSINIA